MKGDKNKMMMMMMMMMVNNKNAFLFHGKFVNNFSVFVLMVISKKKRTSLKIHQRIHNFRLIIMLNSKKKGLGLISCSFFPSKAHVQEPHKIRRPQIIFFQNLSQHLR